MDFSATGTKQRKQRFVGGKTVYRKKDGTPRRLLSEKKRELRMNRQTKTRDKTNRRRPSVLETKMASVSIIRSSEEPWWVVGTWRVCTACESGDDPHICQMAHYTMNTRDFNQEKFEQQDYDSS